jgi:glycosyltransferase involved in cell wall biosynthesis
MNILVFSTVFHPAVGGLENQTLILIREFIKLGHSVKVITDQKQFLPSKDFEVFETPSFLRKLKLFFWCNAFYMPNISLKGAWLMLFNPKKKWVISHNDYYLHNRASIKTRIKRMLIKMASKNISVSSSVAGYINTSSTVIYNCYDDAIFKLYPEEQRVFDIVFLGRLVSQKGCDTLVKACTKLKQPFTLNIVGDGPEKARLQQMVTAAGLTDSIKFLGTKRGLELAKILNRHRIMVVPSAKSEGFGIVVLEGLACGCKMIASNADGLMEAVGKFGEIFPMKNDNALATLLGKSLDTAPTTPVISEELKIYLRNHNKHVVSEQYLSVFDS